MWKDLQYNANKRRQHNPGMNRGYFSGGASFVTNGYVVYGSGINPHDSNPYAVAQGLTEIDRNLYKKSLNEQSNFFKLVKKLEKIMKAEEKKEQQFLRNKIDQLRNNSVFPNYSSEAAQEYIDIIEDAYDKGNFSLAYTLLMKRTRDVAEIKRELLKGKYMAKHNDFYNMRFGAAMIEQLKALFEQTDPNVPPVLATMTNPKATIEDLIDQYIAYVITGDYNGQLTRAEQVSTEKIRGQFIYEFAKTVRANTTSKTKSYRKMTSDLNKLMAEYANSSRDKDKDKKTKAVRTMRKDNKGALKLETIIKEMTDGIARGMSEELNNLGSARRAGMYGINTGGLMRSHGSIRQDKTDTLLYETSANIDVDEIVSKIYGDKEILSQNKLDEIYKSLEKEEEIFKDMFFIQVSAKGYTSDHDLQIEGDAKFINTVNKLDTLNTLYNNGTSDNAKERLIFFLNNTVEDCLASRKKDRIGLYIAAACVAWMWSDSLEMIEAGGVSIDLVLDKTIHLFDHNGVYYTASQIMSQTVANLVTNEKLTSRDFVKVEINPADSLSPNKYKVLCSKYPVTESMPHDTWQAMLQQRWEEEKERVMTHSTLSIHFRQHALQSLLGNLDEVFN